MSRSQLPAVVPAPLTGVLVEPETMPAMFRIPQWVIDCCRVLVVLMICLVPESAWAQASPFLTGANSLVVNLQAWLTPIAILTLITVAFFALANRMSWAWALSVMLAIVVGFGAPQLITWVRTTFAV